MKKSEILNSEISSVISLMGHTDELTICDCGLPIHGAPRIDLALHKGVPSFLDTLKTVLSDLCIQEVIMAEEIKTASPGLLEEILRVLPNNVKITYIPHEELKKRSQNSRAIIRTGECTSFANIILVSGVTF